MNNLLIPAKFFCSCMSTFFFEKSYFHWENSLPVSMTLFKCHQKKEKSPHTLPDPLDIRSGSSKNSINSKIVYTSIYQYLFSLRQVYAFFFFLISFISLFYFFPYNAALHHWPILKQTSIEFKPNGHVCYIDFK